MDDNLINQKDSFTGFHTKDALKAYLGKILRDRIPNKNNYAIIIFDLDRFKSINDKHGHLVGDEALKHFTKLLNKTLRGEHFVARYGGDEFVVVMSLQTDENDAVILAERFQHQLNEQPMYLSKTMQDLKLSASIGIATTFDPFQSADQLIEQADKSLYFVKKHGRSFITTFSSLKEKKKQYHLRFLTKATIISAILLFIFILLLNFKFTFIPTNHVFDEYYYIHLKNGQDIKGWLIRETDANLLISLKEKYSRMFPFTSFIYFDQPLIIPQSEIFYIHHNDNLSSENFDYCQIALKNGRTINAWMIQQEPEYAIVSFVNPPKDYVIKDKKNYLDINYPVKIPKDSIIQYVELN